MASIISFIDAILFLVLSTLLLNNKLVTDEHCTGPSLKDSCIPMKEAATLLKDSAKSDDESSKIVVAGLFASHSKLS